MTTPLFSIIIPTFNRAHTIGRAIDSCLAQTVKQYEIIVIDDCRSTDDLKTVLSLYHDVCDITLIDNHHGKAAAARNTGIQKATGRYIAFLDADDYFLPEKLATNLSKLVDEPDTLFYSQNYVDRGVNRCWIKPARGLASDENMYDYLFLHKGWIHPSSIVLDAQLARSNLFNESLSFGDDTQFVIDLWLQGTQIKMIDVPLSVYDDPYCPERLSQSPAFESGNTLEHRNFMNWVESHKTDIPTLAYLAYRASFRSRFFAKHAPAEALRDIWQAKAGGALGTRQCLVQTLQTFVPGVYRKLTDMVVRYRGIDLAEHC